MRALSAADRGRLVKVLSLLASPHAGERDAAGCAAVRLLQERKLGWADVIPPASAAPRANWPGDRPSRPTEGQAATWQNSVMACRRCPELLTAWELSFLASLLKHRSLSRKQSAVLTDIVSKVRDAGGFE